MQETSYKLENKGDSECRKATHGYGEAAEAITGRYFFRREMIVHSFPLGSP